MPAVVVVPVSWAFLAALSFIMHPKLRGTKRIGIGVEREDLEAAKPGLTQPDFCRSCASHQTEIMAA